MQWTMRSFGLLVIVTPLVPSSTPRACGEPPALHGTASTPDRTESDRLPAGTIRKGTLASETLTHDALAGVGVACETMSLEAPKVIEPYVVDDPVGPPGSRRWREKWLVMDDRDRWGAITLRFEEDGREGAHWTVEAAVPLPQHDAAKDDAVRADIAGYRDAARTFVEKAQKGDAEGMVAVTSLVTIENEGGAESLKTQYIDRVLPRLEQSDVTWEDSFELMTDEAGNRGVEIRCAVAGEQAFPLYLWVMMEGGRHVVTGLSRTSYADLLREQR